MSAKEPALVHLVAGRYRDLQGLSTMANAAMLLLCAGFVYWGRERWHLPVMAAVVGGYLWFRFTWLRAALDEYYTRRCGRAGVSQYARVQGVFILQGAISAPVLRDLHVPMPAGVAIILLMLGGEAAWIAARDLPYRAHWWLPVFAAVICAAKYTGVTTVEQTFAWEAFALLTAGTAWALAGLGDHALLLRTLTHQGELSGVPDRAEPPSP
jgi:hypothetical protein